MASFFVRAVFYAKYTQTRPGVTSPQMAQLGVFECISDWHYILFIFVLTVATLSNNIKTVDSACMIFGSLLHHSCLGLSLS